MQVQWYWRRLSRMSAGEVVRRARDEARRRAWRRHQVRPGQVGAPAVPAGPFRSFPRSLPPGAALEVPECSRRALVEAADRICEGHGTILGVARDDLHAPDWFLDPVTGRRAPQTRFSFSIDHRSEKEVGNVKEVWELSRHHHLTVLAAARFVTGEDRYAEVVDRQLRSWWRENPFLSGVHWTSGIELGIRLISWAWIRRLLEGWPGATDLFEDNELALRQLYWHQQYLAAFPSSGSSANNHVIAEAAGRLVASCAFPWFPESSRWGASAAAVLERELERNTFPSGVNRELASEYHCFVTELGLVAAGEAVATGHALSDATWARLSRAVDAAAALVDERLGGPRQGDGDNGRALLVDAPDPNHWPSLLALGAGLLGPLTWWPATSPADVRSTFLTTLAGGPREVTGRPPKRPSHFADAGVTILRIPRSDEPEIWCRCDGGPHGFLSIAAHAHADALSIEVRHGGVEVLVDPGTYCYHGEPEWRAYFRSTVGHNTLELGGQDQSCPGGPFLWLAQASSRLLDLRVDAEDGRRSWQAEHDGYRRLDPPALHRRSVHLEASSRRLVVVDQVITNGRHPCRLAFHLGPTVGVDLRGTVAELGWPAPGGRAGGRLHLPKQLEWAIHRGLTNPILGWYSSAFGRRQPTATLLGTGTCGVEDERLVTTLDFQS